MQFLDLANLQFRPLHVNSFSYNSITFNYTIFIEAATIVTEIVMINCRTISPRFYTEW